MKTQKPLLSVAIIFKNEIRCLERCLKSFQPLRERVPMEIVMADTGSDDGSREIAEKYADLVIDFPWIKDFAAARNAGLDRCRGQWVLVVDSDEWLDADINELVDFLYENKDGPARDGVPCNVFYIFIRNYHSEDFTTYSDFSGARLLWREGVRYKGAIHEVPLYSEPYETRTLLHTFLHHDGYVQAAKNQAKLDRNLELIREKLKKDPDDLIALQQYIESAVLEEDRVKKIRHAVAMIKKKHTYWDILGPSLLRYAVMAAIDRDLPELEPWTKLAEKLFPESYYVRLDINYFLAARAYQKGAYEECIRREKAYLAARATLWDDPRGIWEFRNGTFQTDSPNTAEEVKVLLADSYTRTKQPEPALETLSAIDCTLLNESQASMLTQALVGFHAYTELDSAPLVRSVWDALRQPSPSEDVSKRREAAFLQTARPAFSKKYQNARRPLWTMFLPLEGECVLGDAAAALETGDPEKLDVLLARQEDLTAFPFDAFAHALECGANFPPPEKPLNMEDLDALAWSLCADKDRLLALARASAAGNFAEDWQSLSWARALILAALRVFDWKEGDPEEGFAFVRAFTAVESNFLPRCYTQDALRDARVLPPLHRFGMYCVKAFAALDAGDSLACVRALRDGLESYKEMKDMVDFLLREVERQERRRSAPPELLQLAEQLRGILAGYSPDDPALAELKNSPAYQKVAYLLEE